MSELTPWPMFDRQDLQVSLTNNQAPSFVLEHYDRSLASNYSDDAACANTIVLLFAKIQRLFHRTASSHSEEDWNALETSVDFWNERRKDVFQPVFEEDSDPQNGRPVPMIWLINAPQVIALQHYYACKMLMLLYRPSAQAAAGFTGAKQRRAVEVCKLCGYG